MDQYLQNRRYSLLDDLSKVRRQVIAGDLNLPELCGELEMFTLLFLEYTNTKISLVVPTIQDIYVDPVVKQQTQNIFEKSDYISEELVYFLDMHRKKENECDDSPDQIQQSLISLFGDIEDVLRNL